MVSRMFSLLFGCRHRQLTRPITQVRKPHTQPATAYVACLDCGQRFHYDVQNMQMGAPVNAPAAGSSSHSDCFQLQP